MENKVKIVRGKPINPFALQLKDAIIFAYRVGIRIPFICVDTEIFDEENVNNRKDGRLVLFA